MAEMRMEIEIDAPVEKVYEYVANVQNHALYADFVERLEITSPYPLGLGVTFNQYINLDGQLRAVPSQVIELAPDRKVVWTSPARGYLMLVTYIFEPTARGTRVIHTGEAPWYDDPAEQARWRAGNAKELANLKRLVEEGV